MMEPENQVCVHFRSLGVCAECAQAREGDRELVVDEAPPWSPTSLPKPEEGIPGPPLKGWIDAYVVTPQAKERRERIATAVLAGFCTPVWDPEQQRIAAINKAEAVDAAIDYADALIEALDK